MIQSQRFCQYLGHEQHQCTIVCTFLQCKETIKWVCPECLRKQLHQHGQSSNDHLMNQKEFLDYLTQNKQMDFIDQCQIQLNTLIKSINTFQQYLKNNYDVKNIIEVVKQDFLSLSDDQICRAQQQQKQNHKQIQQNFLNINQQAQAFQQLMDLQQFNIVQVQSKKSSISLIKNPVKSDIQNVNPDQINKINSNQQIYQSQIKTPENKIKLLNANFQYENYIQLVNKQFIRYAQISQNEKYLALCQDKKLILHNLEDKSYLREIILDKDIYYCLFGKKSTLIYVGCDGGWLYCIELENFQSLKYFDEDVQLFNYFIEKASSKILFGQGRSICEIDFTELSLVIPIEEAHSDNIIQIQYDEINKIIVSCSIDKSIHFFSEEGDIIINQEQTHQSRLKQIQLINNNQQLLSLCINGVLFLWSINLEKKYIQQILKLNSEQTTLSFNSVFNDKYIIIQSQYNLDLIDTQFRYLKQISSSEKDQIRGKHLLIYLRQCKCETNKFHELHNNSKIQYQISIQLLGQLTIMKQIKN
ncbi:hypothetical protein pb186bvf_005861 [Paramecium bursaria]